MSNEHILYLKRIKKNKFIVHLFQILIFVILVFLWQILANLGIINTFIYSSPKKVIMTVIDLYNRYNLISHIGITIYEVLISFSLATILGIIIASILWFNKNIYKIVEPYLTILNSLPKVALGPIIIIWFKAGMKSIIVMSLLISLILTIVNVYEGFNNTDKNKINLMKSLGSNKKDLYFKLILPNSRSNIINILKINISMSLIGVIMGEFLVSKKGIGYLILYGSQVFNLSLVISGIIVLMIISVIMYTSVCLIEKKIS